jgi:hypothetical protein
MKEGSKMNYLTDGYHFFTKIQDNPHNAAVGTTAGFSLLRKQNSVVIEPFPENLSGLALAMICDTGKNEPHIYIPGTFKKGILKYPFSPGMNKIIAVAMLKDGQPVYLSISKGTQLNIEKLFQTNKIAEKLLTFDPFGTTNPAYSWLVCTSERLFRQELRNRDITLPVSLESNALKAITDYKHILFGNYTEEETLREFFIVGVPTKSPEISCAYNEKYNAARYVEVTYHYNVRTYNGYHLYYIDKKSTALVKVVLKNKKQ